MEQVSFWAIKQQCMQSLPTDLSPSRTSAPVPEQGPKQINSSIRSKGEGQVTESKEQLTRYHPFCSCCFVVQVRASLAVVTGCLRRSCLAASPPEKGMCAAGTYVCLGV